MIIDGPSAAVIVEGAGRLTALEAPMLTRAAIQFAHPLGEKPGDRPDHRHTARRPPAGSSVQPLPGADSDHIRRFGGRAFIIEELTATGSLPPAVVEAGAAVHGYRGQRGPEHGVPLFAWQRGRVRLSGLRLEA